MSVRRFGRVIKPLHEKRPRAYCRHIRDRVNPQGKLQQFHFHKGWRRMV